MTPLRPARIAVVLMAGLPALALAQASCTVEQNGDEVVVRVDVERDALGGRWQEMGAFRVRTALVTPEGRSPWLLVEVHARSDDDDHRIVSSQKVSAPFVTGRVEVVEPRLGRSLRYECGGSR